MSYFARPRSRKAVRWQSSPAVARLIGMPAKPKRRRASPEHDAQVALFRDHIEPRLIAGAVAFAIPNGGFRHKKIAEELRAEGVVAGVWLAFADSWRRAGAEIFDRSRAAR